MHIKSILPGILLLGFLLGIHDGMIALWKDQDPQPIRVFPYSAASLPRSDREALEKGIHVDSAEELMRFLEDYMS